MIALGFGLGFAMVTALALLIIIPLIKLGTIALVMVISLKLIECLFKR